MLITITSSTATIDAGGLAPLAVLPAYRLGVSRRVMSGAAQSLRREGNLSHA